MNTVVIQMLERENSDGTRHSFIGPAGQLDATEPSCANADTNDFKVYLGLYLPNWNHDRPGAISLVERRAAMAEVAAAGLGSLPERKPTSLSSLVGI